MIMSESTNISQKIIPFSHLPFVNRLLSMSVGRITELKYVEYKTLNFFTWFPLFRTEKVPRLFESFPHFSSIFSANF